MSGATDLASLLALLGTTWWALVLWARASGSRAWPKAEGARSGNLRAGVWALLLLQAGTAYAVHGLLAGAFVLACAWMAAGFVFVMGWSVAPRWHWRAGSAVGAACVVGCLLLVLG